MSRTLGLIQGDLVNSQRFFWPLICTGPIEAVCVVGLHSKSHGVCIHTLERYRTCNEWWMSVGAHTQLQSLPAAVVLIHKVK